MAMKIQCPDCKVIIKIANPIAEGRKIRCPKCEHIFPYSSKGGRVSSKRSTGIELDGPRRVKSDGDTRLDVEDTPPRRKTKVDADDVPPRGRMRSDQTKPRSPRRHDPAEPAEARRPTKRDDGKSKPRTKAPPPDDDDTEIEDQPQYDAPRRQASHRTEAAKPRRSIWVMLCIVAAGAVLVLGAIAGAMLLLGSGSSNANYKVNRENFQKLRLDMPKAEVEKLLGAGSAVGEKELMAATKRAQIDFDPVHKQWLPVARQRGANDWEEWRNRDHHIFIAYGTDAAGAARVRFFVWLDSGPKFEIETAP